MRSSTVRFILLAAFIVAAFALARAAGLGAYIQGGGLRDFINSLGAWAPAAYIALYVLAACLMLPGLPVTVLGGVLFGPFLGVLYVAIGATLGASAAFLIARYMGRQWVEGVLKGGRLKELYDRTEEQGWKVVAFTRLIPVFPYNFLNYAFGLTRIRFTHYALASLVFMLPGIVAYVVFSSSILDIARGSFSASFFIGLALVIAVSLIPIIYKRLKKKGGPIGRR